MIAFEFIEKLHGS